MEQYRGTTICSVRRGNTVVMGGDGQVTLGQRGATHTQHAALEGKIAANLGARHILNATKAVRFVRRVVDGQAQPGIARQAG